MKRRTLLLAAAVALAGCASAPRTGAGLPPREQIRDFAIEARFALRLEAPPGPARSASGRLSWRHDRSGDVIFLANPLGQGLAEIRRGPAGATLRQSDGTVRQAADAATLLEDGTGYRLPLEHLPAWLLGRAGPDGRLERDPRGRPVALVESGWQIGFGYADDAPDALPARLILTRPETMEIRLHIESWENLP